LHLAIKAHSRVTAPYIAHEKTVLNINYTLKFILFYSIAWMAIFASSKHLYADLKKAYSDMMHFSKIEILKYLV
jgi:hypothetical protein